MYTSNNEDAICIVNRFIFLFEFDSSYVFAGIFSVNQTNDGIESFTKSCFSLFLSFSTSDKKNVNLEEVEEKRQFGIWEAIFCCCCRRKHLKMHEKTL